MNNGDDISNDDRKLFRNSVGKVKRLRQDRNQPQPPTRSPQRRKRLSEDIQRSIDPGDVPLSDQYQPQDDSGAVAADETLFFTRQGVQHKTLRRLKRGQLPCPMTLDLHGMTVAEAREALADFIDTCRRQQLRSARIIHGKGNRSVDSQPVLKGMVNTWLRQHEGVLAFCSARPADGGTGAVYVLIRA